MDSLAGEFQDRAVPLPRSGLESAMIECSPWGIAAFDANGCVISWNAAAERIWGLPRQTVIGRKPPVPFEAGPDRNFHVLRPDGQAMELSCCVVRLPLAGGLSGQLAMFSDITEEKKLRRLAEHRDKMESLGVFAGGVAHDFNNLLTGILGNAGLGLYTTEEGTEIRTHLQEIIRAAERAGALTRQLLAYAGKGRFVSAKLNLSDLVRDIAPVAQSSIANKRIRVKLDLDFDLPSIDGDPGQLQQVILSLLMNSAEAINGHSGVIGIATREETVPSGTVHSGGFGEPLRAGRYAVLEIEDSGSGIDEATLARMFEPFFSTKFTGRGLGLSAALGIVRQHGGGISAQSVPGQGSTFRVYLPSIEDPAAMDTRSPGKDDFRGTGLILVADDEESVRTAVHRSLQYWGYDTILAENGQAAVELFSRFSGRIRAVILDLIMPVMGGEEALWHLRSVNPDMPAILMSGYRQELSPPRLSGGEAAFLQKPFTAEQLGQKLCGLLAGENRVLNFDRKGEPVGDR